MKTFMQPLEKEEEENKARMKGGNSNTFDFSNLSLNEISKKREDELNTLWDEVIRIKNPHKYYVDLSDKLWNLKNKMIN